MLVLREIKVTLENAERPDPQEPKAKLEQPAPKVQKGILEHAVPLGLLARKVQLALRVPQLKCRQPTRAAVPWSG